MLMHLGALPPPLVSQLGAKDLLVRGWGVFSLQGHIPLNCLPNFSSLHHFSCSAFFLSPLSSSSHFFYSSYSTFFPRSGLFLTYTVFSHFLLNRTFHFHTLICFTLSSLSTPLPLSAIHLLCSRA